MNAKNVLGEPLKVCGCDPMTGWMRNGSCETGPEDRGSHTVCAVMTTDFLSYTLEQGNDLVSPKPAFHFPGLKPGDHWCLCASRWDEARRAGAAPPVLLEACHASALQIVSIDHLKQHAVKT